MKPARSITRVPHNWRGPYIVRRWSGPGFRYYRGGGPLDAPNRRAAHNEAHGLSLANPAELVVLVNGDMRIVAQLLNGRTVRP